VQFNANCFLNDEATVRWNREACHSDHNTTNDDGYDGGCTYSDYSDACAVVIHSGKLESSASELKQS